MKKIYILQVHTGTLPGNIIKVFTKYQYSHILLSLDRSLTKMYSFGRKTLFNPLNGGFVIEDINGPFFKRFNKTKCRIYELTITNKQYSRLNNIIDEYVKNMDEYKYDIIGLILRFFLIPIKRKKYYVCSQFVAELLTKANIHNFNKKNRFVRPNDFEYINGAKEIYSGYLLSNKKTV